MTKSAAHEEHRVVFFSPGLLFPEQTGRVVASWDPALAMALWPSVAERHGAKPYAFQFVTMLVHPPIDVAGRGPLYVEPKEIARSSTYHIAGTLLTYDEVAARNDPREDILRRNMRDGRPIVCVTTHSYRATISFEESDVMVNLAGAIVERGNTPDRIAYRARMKAEYQAELEAELDEMVRQHKSQKDGARS